jgi:hypothetical protein
MTTPTVAVTVTLESQEGVPYEGVTVRARLDGNEVYEGIVISDQAEAVTDASGVAVLDLFPNAPSPDGMGTQGTTYRFNAVIPGGRALNVNARVPNTACRLENILVSTDVEPLSASELALSQAQAAVAGISATAAAAASSASAASGSATAAAGSATAAAGSATSASGSASAAAASEAAAAASVGQAQFATYAALRAYAGSSTAAYVTGYLVTSAPLGVAGLFTRDDADTTTADNGGTIIVAANGKRWKRVHQGKVMVDWFAAAGDGATNDQVPAAAAIAYAKTLQRSEGGMVNGYTTPAVCFTDGKEYVLTGNLDLGTDLHVIGGDARAIIKSSSAYPFTQTTPLFVNVGPGCVIRGLSILGFTDHVQIATANLDASCIGIFGNEFQEWSGTSIKVDSNSASTLLLIKDNKFYARSAAAFVLENRCDRCSFEDNWVQGPCDIFFKNYKGLHLSRMLGVPGASTASSVWVLNEGTELVATECRFGGEAGARTIVNQKTGPGGTNATKLVIDNCEVWSTGFPTIVFDEIPDVFAFTRNYGLNGSYPFKFNAVSADTRNGLGSRNTWDVRDNVHEIGILGGLLNSTEDLTTAMKAALVQNRTAGLGTSSIKYADVVRNILYTEAGFGFSTSSSMGGGGAGTDIFGAATQTITGVNGINSFNMSWDTLLNGLAAGTYTALVNIEVSARPVQFMVYAGGNWRVENLVPGEYTIALPFYYDGATVAQQAAGYYFKNLCAGGTISHNGMRIVSGMHDSYKQWNTEFYGTAAPAAGYWRAADRQIQLAPTVGQPKAWVCTVAGTPGTWVSEGNL